LAYLQFSAAAVMLIVVGTTDSVVIRLSWLGTEDSVIRFPRLCQIDVLWQ